MKEAGQPSVCWDDLARRTPFAVTAWPAVAGRWLDETRIPNECLVETQPLERIPIGWHACHGRPDGSVSEPVRQNFGLPRRSHKAPRAVGLSRSPATARRPCPADLPCAWRDVCEERSLHGQNRMYHHRRTDVKITLRAWSRRRRHAVRLTARA